MVDFEFEFQYAEAKQTALHKAAGCIPARSPRRGKSCAFPAYLEILTVPMALRVIRIAETLSASAETRGIDLKRRKSNFLSLRFSALDAVFAAVLLAAIAAGLLL